MERIVLAALLTAIALAAPSPSQAETRLRVMSFNIYGGGLNGVGSVDEVVAAIKAAKADIVGLQEVSDEPADCSADNCPAGNGNVAADIARALGWHLSDQVSENEALWSNAIVSRYPIGTPTPNGLGVPIDVAGRKVFLFNVHLDDSPYQPYQAVGIEYGSAPFTKDPAELIRFARETRGGAIALLTEDLKSANDAAAVFVTGDFNEPSHLDWTAAAVAAGLQPLVVAYPTSTSMADLGFTDSFRAAHPDVAARPGFTWTPSTKPDDPEDHHDRIDFVYARSEGLKVIGAEVVGEKAPEADIVVPNWFSDHRAVVADVVF